jgi:hypothetical protein
LRKEPHQRSPLLAFRQPVRPILLQAVRGLARVQAFLGVGIESLYHLIRGNGVPEGSVAAEHRVRCGVHKAYSLSRGPHFCVWRRGGSFVNLSIALAQHWASSCKPGERYRALFR